MKGSKFLFPYRDDTLEKIDEIYSDIKAKKNGELDMTYKEIENKYNISHRLRRKIDEWYSE